MTVLVACENTIGQFKENHPNMVVLVIVANISMVRAIVSLVMKASPRAAASMVMVKTLEEARIIVQERGICRTASQQSN